MRIPRAASSFIKDGRVIAPPLDLPRCESVATMAPVNTVSFLSKSSCKRSPLKVLDLVRFLLSRLAPPREVKLLASPPAVGPVPASDRAPLLLFRIPVARCGPACVPLQSGRSLPSTLPAANWSAQLAWASRGQKLRSFRRRTALSPARREPSIVSRRKSPRPSVESQNRAEYTDCVFPADRARRSVGQVRRPDVSHVPPPHFPDHYLRERSSLLLPPRPTTYPYRRYGS